MASDLRSPIELRSPVVVSPRDPSPDVSFLWQEARGIFLQQLDPKERKKESFKDDATLDDTLKSLKLAQDKAASQYGTHLAGKPIEFKLGRVMKRLELLLQMGDEAMRFAPESASYVWSAFRIIFTVWGLDFSDRGTTN
jgi:hypothetical protein